MSTLTPEARRALIQLLRQHLSTIDAKDIADDWGNTVGLGAGLYDGLAGGGTHERIAALVDRAQQVDRVVELFRIIEHWRTDLRDALAPLRPAPSATATASTPSATVNRLQDYKDKILYWKNNEGLDDLGGSHPLRKTARDLTLTTMPLLTRKEKGVLLLFLYEEGLIWGGSPIIDLSEADLSEANLTAAELTAADLSGANLTGADLSGAGLGAAKLTGADLSGADLRGADFGFANLCGAKLTGADLNGAYLFRANLQDTLVTDEQIKSAKTYEGIKNRIVE